MLSASKGDRTMDYHEYAPHPRLARDVKLFWTLEADAPKLGATPHRILPDGIVEVVIHYREPYLMRRDGEPHYEQQPSSFAVSQTKRFLEIQPAGRSGFVAIRFYPWGARRFFHVPVHEFADREIELDLLWGRSARELAERVGNARSSPERVALAEAFLLRRFDDRDRDVVDHGLRTIWAHPGRLNVRQLSQSLSTSERSLERRFRESVGASPKRMIRLVRFLSICRELRQGVANLASLAHDGGYFDQAHFIKECRALSGLTPGELANRGELSFFELG
jgi:AraC-like DNA-binding protein